jgi:hypothetical protein
VYPKQNMHFGGEAFGEQTGQAGMMFAKVL